MSRLQLDRYQAAVNGISPFPVYGHVTNVLGLVIEGYCADAPVGATCEIFSLDHRNSCLAEVIGFKDDKVVLMLLGELQGIGLGSAIALKNSAATVKVGPQMLGRVLDGLANPIDGGIPLECEEEFSIYSSPINPLKRARISEPLDLGIRAVNGLLTIGKGQRVGIIAGSGVGKSVLLGMMARSTQADVNVIALIGERGREVREFIEKDLGSESLSRSIIVCATSDVSPVVRMRAVFVAATIAEYFRREGKNVLFMMDSITRFAMAQREVGLSAGEPPTTKGYPPSVFTKLPIIFERAGNTSSGGSITGLYTVLVEADDINDPIGDAVRSIADGHMVLSRKLAARNHYPAIDIPVSASRVMGDVVSKEHKELSGRMKAIIANYAEAEDLINIGAYVKGSNPNVDEAIQFIEPIRAFLRQNVELKVNLAETVAQMRNIFQTQTQAQGRR
ncbi:MAG: FliI/YscN family ATPase [Deltaproteobacteria bacterium]|nr:FliI/YscN family ATPase [Deltaproteobacteria bacterium]